jgi:hypothetical protein
VKLTQMMSAVLGSWLNHQLGDSKLGSATLAISLSEFLPFSAPGSSSVKWENTYTHTLTIEHCELLN